MKTNGQLHIQALLNEKLMEYRTVNPRFSIRAFALKLGMQPSATNEILKGQRRVSAKMAAKIADKLMLNPSERARLLATFPITLKRNSKISNFKDEEMKTLQLSSKQFEVISDPIHFAILSLMKTKNFISDLDWMAMRFAKSKYRIASAIKNLLDLELIKKNKFGEYIRTTNHINTSDDILNLSIQNAHLNDLEMAKDKLRDVDVKLRDYTSFTLPVDPKLLGKAKEIIRRAQDEIERIMLEEGEATEVYKTSTYLYPMTKQELEI